MNRNHESEAGKSSQTTRRDFCAGLVVSSAGLVLAPTIVGEVKAAQDSMVAYPPKRIEGAAALLPGSSLYFDYPTRNDPAVLLRSTDGEFMAYSRRCSHAGCSVDFDRSNQCLRCPCHKGMFDGRMGHVMFGPPRRPLEIIFLQVRAGGELWAVGKSYGRDGDVHIAVGGVE